MSFSKDFNLSNGELEKYKNKMYLLISLFLFFKKNGYEESASSILKEANLEKIIESYNKSKNNENEVFDLYDENLLIINELINKTDEFPEKPSFLAENWMEFWGVFFKKVENMNQIEENKDYISNKLLIDNIISKESMKIEYSYSDEQ